MSSFRLIPNETKAEGSDVFFPAEWHTGSHFMGAAYSLLGVRTQIFWLFHSKTGAAAVVLH